MKLFSSILGLSCALSLSFVQPTFAAATLNETFEQLRDTAIDYDYEIIGTICEQVAKLQLEESYGPREYTVKTGIAYGDGKRTIGELDVVVFRNSDSEAILVAEVKCWRKMGSGLSKAREQRSRFQRTILRGSEIELYDVSNRRVHYRADQFDEVQTYLAISQDGGVDVGYEMDLPFTLDELMLLRQHMIDCQNRGRCEGPRGRN